MFRSILSLISLLPMLAVAAQGLSSHHYRVLSEADKLLQAGQAVEAAASLWPLIDGEQPPLPVYQYACRAAAEADYPAAQVLSCWQQAQRQFPNEKVPALQLAQHYLQHQRYAEALPLLKPYLNDADDDNVRYQYGYGLYQLGRHQEVLTVLVKPANAALPTPWLPLRSYSALALEDWRQLQQESERWLTQQAEQAQPWQLLAHALMQLDQPQQAATALELLSLLRPEQTRQPLQQLYMQQQAHNLAAECLANDKLTLHCLQQGYLAGKYQLTLEATKQLALTELPPAQQDQLLLLQGRLYSALGDNELARKHWQQVGKGALPQGLDGNTLKTLRQQREYHRGQGLLLIGQSYWLAQQWPEAQMTYRELERLPSFAGNAKALLNNLDYYTNLQ